MNVCFYDSPPHASDLIKTDSAPFLHHSYLFCWSGLFMWMVLYMLVDHAFDFSTWPPVKVNTRFFLVHAIDGLGGGYCRNTRILGTWLRKDS